MIELCVMQTKYITREKKCDCHHVCYPFSGPRFVMLGASATYSVGATPTPSDYPILTLVVIPLSLFYPHRAMKIKIVVIITEL